MRVLCLDDTIVAVSSPPGRSPRGLVRVSGPGTRAVLGACITPATPPPRELVTCRVALAPTPPSTLHPPLSTLPSPLPLLPALLAFFPAPHSYTGQDAAELHCPGNPALLERLLHTLAGPGRARLAEPGEFTFRAFVAGKLDLTQAEGVAATIAATSDGQLQAATLLREGRLGALARALVRDLAEQLALVEAGIDFTDQDDVAPIAPGRLAQNLAAIAARLADILAHSRAWGALEALPRVVLVGAPSSGKSTLFNALLGRPRAVISPTPGTTRDVLEEPLTLHAPGQPPREIMLVDLAGLDDPRSALDREIQAAARRSIERADLVLLALPPLPEGEGGGEGVSVNVALPPHLPVLRLRTKADLPAPPGAPACELAVSAHTGQGLDALRQLIGQRLGMRGVSVQADLLALQPRHEAALRHTAEHIGRARDLLSPQQDAGAIARVELVAGALRAALDELEALGGRMTPDDVIGRIFATFCVGK